MITKARIRLYKEICPNLFLSFPKSGKTLTKRMLEKYFEWLNGAEPGTLDFERWTPFLRVGAWAKAPGIHFAHGAYRSDDEGAEVSWMERQARANLIFQTRDPREVTLTYYFQRTRRFHDPDVAALDYRAFIRHPRYGIERIVRYMNAVHRRRDVFRSFLHLRYEDVVSDPGPALGRLIAALGAPVDERALAMAVEGVPDTTRNIEGGGFDLLERIASGSPDESVWAGDWRSLGLPSWSELLPEEDVRYVDSRFDALDPGLGYQQAGC